MFLNIFGRFKFFAMYQTLLSVHNAMRWLVLAGLLIAIFRAGRGLLLKSDFLKTDDSIRHWTATLLHIQLMVGMVLYFKSPIVKYTWAHFGESLDKLELTFFSLIHSSFMLAAIVIVTIASAKAKRQLRSRDKFRTMLVWYSIALLLILAAIPWPFSPFVTRPYLR